MQPFRRLDAIAAALPLANVDTDMILAGRYLKTTTRKGLGEKLFWPLRCDPDFVLNRAPWIQAGILVALENFGCGSSREHAPWALQDFGIRCIIAPTIADIFYNNCLKNGILPIALPRAAIDLLLERAADPETARMSVDLETRTISSPGCPRIDFDIAEGHKDDLLLGVDEISRSMTYEADIAKFEMRQALHQPWVQATRWPQP